MGFNEPPGVDGRLLPAEERKAGDGLGEDPEKAPGSVLEELLWLRSSLRARGVKEFAERLRSESGEPRVDDLGGTLLRSGNRGNSEAVEDARFLGW